MPSTLEEKVQLHKEMKIRGMHIPMLMDEDEGKTGRTFSVVRIIEDQREKNENNNGITYIEEFSHLCQ